MFLGTTLIGWLSAMGLSRVATSHLELPEDAALTDVSGTQSADADGDDEPPRSRRSSNRRTSKKTYIDSIVARNIFDSSKVGQTGNTEAFTGDERKSDLKVVLLATIVAEPADFSSALIAEEKGSGAVGYGINDDLLGEGVIAGIEPRRVLIRRSDGSLEYIAMEEGQSYKKEEKGGRSGAAADDDSGIEKTGDNKYTVEQEVIDQIMENPEKLYSQIRVVPHKDANGEIDGYRVSGVRRKSFFYKLGVKNGDIVHNVNNKPLTSMSNAMDAYNSLADAKSFNFEITRRNQRQTFDYEIR
ncbi:MAG: type II secretion system protein GspC [Myxococcota bacterium]|nr:type II secretion system protein GspC [Myxococcota bacterium]